MAEQDIEDAFKDFEVKVDEKKKKKNDELETSESKESKEHANETDLKRKFEAEKQALKEKYKEEFKALQAKKVEQAIKEGKLSPQRFIIERAVYISVIVILLLVIGFGMLGKGPSLEQSAQNDANSLLGSNQSKANNQSAKAEPKTEPKSEPKTEPKTEPKSEPKPTTTTNPSGTVAFAIDDIDYEKTDATHGQIKTVTFTIENNRDATLTPVVNVYIYDEELEEDWLAKSRGTFTHPAGIAPGKSLQGTITVVPKTFTNLHLDKTVRLELNDTKAGFLKIDTRIVSID